MAETTTIEWTATRLPDGTVLPGFTFNPWTGCAKVSPACQHCYAETFSRRNTTVFGQWGPNAARKRTSEANWRKPLKWNREAEASGIRRKVFCASMADVFEDRPELEAWRLDLWALIEQTPHLDWLLLTKRPDVMARWAKVHGWPANAWAGTTVEDQERADERIPHLLKVPAKVRFLSCEPLLGFVDLTERLCCDGHMCACRGSYGIRDGIRWVIAGGESGHGARPTHPAWIRSLREQCTDIPQYGADFFFKQWGSWAPWDDDHWSLPAGVDDVVARDRALRVDGVDFLCVGKKESGRQLDGRTWDEMPEAPPVTRTWTDDDVEATRETIRTIHGDRTVNSWRLRTCDWLSVNTLPNAGGFTITHQPSRTALLGGAGSVHLLGLHLPACTTRDEALDLLARLSREDWLKGLTHPAGAEAAARLHTIVTAWRTQ